MLYRLRPKTVGTSELTQSCIVCLSSELLGTTFQAVLGYDDFVASLLDSRLFVLEGERMEVDLGSESVALDGLLLMRSPVKVELVGV